ncbi:MAG: hypothetical protein GXO74_08215 [Calditrichaeota bacterium]|nr:hypothetical protein [Calditrichota bacterium]
MRKNIFYSSLLILLIFTLAFAQQVNKRETDQTTGIAKPAAQGPDIAYALQGKGELLNCFMNFGEITDGYFQSEFYDFLWPKSKGAISAGDNCVDDFSMIFACKGNVVDGYTAYRQEDWGPVDGSWGHYHAKNQSEELMHQGYPHLAVSDIPATWPEGYFDENGQFIDTPGEHHWPGKFRIDIDSTSATYGQEVPGEFPADRVIYAALDDADDLQGEPMGIRLDIETYEYGRSYAADFIFYDFTITNTSDTRLDSCWWGYYYDLDYGDYLDEAYKTFKTGLNPGEWDVMMEYDPNGTLPDEFETGAFGVAYFKTPKDMGITDSHYFLDTGPTTDAELWPIISSNPSDPNCPVPKGDYFHGNNVHLDDYTLTQSPPYGYDWVCMETTGPFSLEPGESVKAVLVVSGGENEEDFLANIDIAKGMYLKHYQGPSGPASPKLYAVAGDGEATLYWDNAPELKADPFTGELDFEGYKIYRSVDNGNTWGEKILDGAGNLVGYVPVAQFDLKNTISGLDPLNANSYLGNNSGIRHSWTDTDVSNGVTYSYTITAYDRGQPNKNIPSFESSKGTKATEDNFVQVIPEPPASGAVPPEASVSHIAGMGKGTIDLEILDPNKITDHTYHVVFPDSPGVNFQLVDATDNTTLLESYPINTDEMPVRDGFRIRVNGDDAYGGISAIVDEFGRDVFGKGKSDTTGSWYVEALERWGDFDAKTSNYEIRFTADSSAIGTRIGANIQIAEKVPIQVWNTTFNTRVHFVIQDNGNLQFDEGEKIYIINAPYQELTIGSTYSINLFEQVPLEVTIQNAPTDSAGLPPIEGQKVTIITQRAHTPQDVYKITFTAKSFRAVTDSELDAVRVVPNPYVVNAAWEQGVNVRLMRFMFLPPQCTITIYTTRGEKIRTIRHTNSAGAEDWNVTSDSNQDLAFGVYIYIVETPDGRQKMGKFALIK